MARPKKNAAQAQDTLLTLDTVPEIPVEEQPYPLPEGWKWVRLGSLCSLRNGKAFKPTDWSESGLPIVRIQNLNSPNNKFNYYDGIIEDKFLINSGDLLFAWSGTPGTSFGAHIWKGGKALLNQHIFRVNFEKKIILKIFFKYAINYRLNEFIVKAHGGAGLQHITKKNFENTSLPLPPLEVQQRIVERIESLFAKLDEAREKAESALESFERRKAAILHKAFTGELTRTWRKIQQVSHATWENKTFGTLVANSRLGLVRSKAEQGCQFKYKYLKMNNITSEGIISIKEITNVNASKQEVEQYELKYGDFIFNTRNSFELVGKSAVFNYYENNILYNNNIMRVNFIQNTNPFYINYFLYSPKGKFQLKKIKKNTTNVAAIYAKDLNLIKIPLASFIEQQEIVRILDRIFAKEQQAREAAENVLQRIGQMKKAILARAFRGELG